MKPTQDKESPQERLPLGVAIIYRPLQSRAHCGSSPKQPGALCAPPVENTKCPTKGGFRGIRIEAGPNLLEIQNPKSKLQPTPQAKTNGRRIWVGVTQARRFAGLQTETALRWKGYLKRRLIQCVRQVAGVTMASYNVNPGLINPWLINRGVSPFSGDSSLLEGTPP